MNLRELNEHIEQYAIALMAGEKRRWYDRLFLIFLFVMSRLFRGIVQTRLTLYFDRFLRQRMLGCQVISVGNITVGGTGKTPVVEHLARTLHQQGRKVAILSRGYRSKKVSFFKRLSMRLSGHQVPPRVVSDGENVLLNSELAGDEPFMLASNLPGVFVLVDKDRVKSGNYATNILGADIMILDDGFQYLRLKTHWNICLIDATNPFDNHHVLPRGLLREPIKNLRRANLLLLTKCGGLKGINHLKRFVRSHNKTAKIIESNHSPMNLVDIYTNEEVSLDYLKGKKIAALSGIARPESFESSLERLGGTLVHRDRFADHHRFHKSEVLKCYNNAAKAGAEAIITTHKDTVRIPEDIENAPLPVLYLKIEIDILHGHEYFDEFISKILIRPHNNS